MQRIGATWVILTAFFFQALCTSPDAQAEILRWNPVSPEELRAMIAEQENLADQFALTVVEIVNLREGEILGAIDPSILSAQEVHDRVAALERKTTELAREVGSPLKDRLQVRRLHVPGFWSTYSKRERLFFFAEWLSSTLIATGIARYLSRNIEYTQLAIHPLPGEYFTGWTGAAFWATLVGSFYFYLSMHLAMHGHSDRRQGDEDLAYYNRNAKIKDEAWLRDAFLNRLAKRWDLSIPKKQKDRKRLMEALTDLQNDSVISTLFLRQRLQEYQRFDEILHHAASFFPDTSEQSQYLKRMAATLVQGSKRQIPFADQVDLLAKAKNTLRALASNPSYKGVFDANHFSAEMAANTTFFTSEGLKRELLTDYFSITGDANSAPLSNWILANGGDHLLSESVLEIARVFKIRSWDPKSRIQIAIKTESKTDGSPANHEGWVELLAHVTLPAPSGPIEMNVPFGYATAETQNALIAQSETAAHALSLALEEAFKSDEGLRAEIARCSETFEPSALSNLPTSTPLPNDPASQIIRQQQ